MWLHRGPSRMLFHAVMNVALSLQKQGGLRIWRFFEIIYFLILSDEVILHQLLQSIFWQKNKNFEAILDFIVDIRFKKGSCGDYNHLRQMLLGHHRCSQWWSDAGVSELQNILGIEQRLLAQLHLLPQCRKDHTCWTGRSLSSTCCVKNNFFFVWLTLLGFWPWSHYCSPGKIRCFVHFSWPSPTPTFLWCNINTFKEFLFGRPESWMHLNESRMHATV